MNEYVDNDAVDGFSDVQGETQIGSPDPGTEGMNPLSPEEYAEAQKEIREQGDNNRLSERKED